jgi:hypothetical protein
VSVLSTAGSLEATKAIEPIVAWRTWGLTGHRDGSGLLLRPVAGKSRPWRPMQITEAACKHTRLHSSPSLDCTCGLHGTHGLDLLRRTRCPAVLGRVALWGRVIEHDHGYRAQFAYPQLVTLICQFCFWQWGSHGRSPDVVGWFPRGDDLVPLCWAHLEQAQRYGMEPRRLLAAEETDLGLRETYAVDPLVRW